MRDLEEEKRELSGTLQQQSHQLSILETDRMQVMKELEEREAMTSQLSQEKRHLSETSEELRHRLEEIEKQTATINKEKISAKKKLTENQDRLHQLEEEKSSISGYADELQSTIKDLKAQNELTEKELREEIRARLTAEGRLNEAEISLKLLDRAVQNQTPNIETDIREEMTINVKKLKQFFEDLATESRISSDKPLIMRNSVTARKTLVRRAKTIKYENRKQSSKARATTCINRETRSRQQQLRRAVTSVNPGIRGDYSMNLPAHPDDKIVFEDSL